MTLYRFTAESNHKAISKVNETLGPEALIHSINRISEGVEILAALPQGEDDVLVKHFMVEDFDEEIPSVIEHPPVTEDVITPEKFPVVEEFSVKQIAADQQLMENLNIQMQIMDFNIQKLANQINVLYQVMTDKVKQKKPNQWNLFKFFRFIKKTTSKEGAYGTQSAY